MYKKNYKSSQNRNTYKTIIRYHKQEIIAQTFRDLKGKVDKRVLIFQY